MNEKRRCKNCEEMIILHILDAFTGAGPTRSLLALAKAASEHGLAQHHQVITLRPEAYPISLFQAKRLGIEVLRSPDDKTLYNRLEQADIVQLHYWNNPVIAELLRKELPAMRLLIWFKIMGEFAPQVIISELLDMSDFALATSPLTLELPVFQNRDKRWLSEKADTIYGMADRARLENLRPKKHEGFHVGYIGTVNFSKMHPRFIEMNAAVNVSSLRCIVCGGGIEDQLKKKAENIGAAGLFDFRGYVEDIRSVLETLDVFGYPLCEDTYATSEKSIQEAMYAGVPPVVFPHGGCPDLVKNGETGIIVNKESEYQQAIEYLYHHPEERKRLGKNAAEYARTNFNPLDGVRKIQKIYERLLEIPKKQKNWANRTGNDRTQTASEIFTEQMGEKGKFFEESLTSDHPFKCIKAEKNIMIASDLLIKGEGGLNQFRNYYPEDAYLRLWSGISALGKDKIELAEKEFKTAVDLGLPNWRGEWYLARLEWRRGNKKLAEKYIVNILSHKPELEKYVDSIKEV